MAEINETVRSIDDSDNNVTIIANRSDVDYSDSASRTACDVIWYVVLTLGVPGNVLSAAVWLRRGDKNSSAVYLAALAINDLAFLMFRLPESVVCSRRIGWLCGCWLYLLSSTFTMEPLLVLGFSVERFIAILRPLQVHNICCLQRC